MIKTAASSTPPHLLSPRGLPSLKQPLFLSLQTPLSLFVRTVFLSTNQTLTHTKLTLSSMASSDKVTITKRSSSTGYFAQGSKRARLAFSPANLPVSAATIPAPTAGIGFNFLPPLPIITRPFKFLKSVDLKIIGKDLGDISLGFG